jgi:FtsZ-binding cell division protein ZapB
MPPTATSPQHIEEELGPESTARKEPISYDKVSIKARSREYFRLQGSKDKDTSSERRLELEIQALKETLRGTSQEVRHLRRQTKSLERTNTILQASLIRTKQEGDRASDECVRLADALNSMSASVGLIR